MQKIKQILSFLLGGLFFVPLFFPLVASAVQPFPYPTGGTGTTTPNIGQLVWWGRTNQSGVATTSVTCSGATSCTPFVAIGSSPITITSSAGGIGDLFTHLTNFGTSSSATTTALQASAFFASTTGATSTFAGSLVLFGKFSVGTDNPTQVNANADAVVAGAGAAVVIASTTDNTSLSTAILETYAPGVKFYGGSHGTSQTPVRFGLTLGGWAEVAATSSAQGTLNGLVLGTVPSAPLVFGTFNTERGRFTANGLFTLGTTTPFWELTVASSTGPQLALVDGTNTSNAWTLRAISNSLYFATSTPTATSSKAALSFDGISGAATFGAISTSTFQGGLNLTSGCLTYNGGSCIGGSKIATSTADTANQVTFFTSTNSTPATIGGDAGMTYNSNLDLLTVTNASNTNVTVGTSLGIPTGSNPAPTVAGYIAQSTNAPYQVKIGNSAAGTTVIEPRWHLTINTSTTTTWGGTTTPASAVFVWPQGATIQGANCTVQPSGGTLMAQLQYANATAYTTVNLTTIPASTTPGTYTFSSNNTPTAGATSTLMFGTPASSPTSGSCTFFGVWTGI